MLGGALASVFRRTAEDEEIDEDAYHARKQRLLERRLQRGQARGESSSEGEEAGRRKGKRRRSHRDKEHSRH